MNNIISENYLWPQSIEHLNQTLNQNRQIQLRYFGSNVHQRFIGIQWNLFVFISPPPFFSPHFSTENERKKEKGIQYFFHMFLMSHKILVRSGPILSENYNIWKSILCFSTFYNIFCDKNIQNDKRVPPCYFIKLHIRWASGVNQA